MGKNIFHFKAFSVRQEHAPMRVCTDSCLFAAWAAAKIKADLPDASHLLDIGTGTGLLSLMIAQQVGVKITAVEIDAASVLDAEYNFAHGPWKDRLKVHHTSIQDFAKGSPKKIDVVICNPPFFSKSLKSPRKEKNLSKHELDLSLEMLLVHIWKLLDDKGIAFLMLPSERDVRFREIATAQGFYICEMVMVHQTPAHRAFRTFYCIAKHMTHPLVESTLNIKNDKERYSDEFIDLLKPYYLAL